MDRAPLEVNGQLQDYLSEFDRFASGQPLDVAHLGRSLAYEAGKLPSKNDIAIGRQICVFILRKRLNILNVCRFCT